MPNSASTMNYNCVILGGVVALTAAWWFIHAGKNYPGPKVMTIYIHDDKPSETPIQGVRLNEEGSTQEKTDVPPDVPSS